LSEEPDEKTRCPDHAAIVADDTARVGRALRELPDDQCEVIVLHLQGGLTFKAIAEALGVSINTVQSRYRYGVEKLRILLKGELTYEKCTANRKNGQGIFLPD
jgi:RNA polymerase sigma factor (sigma-70 family)